MARNSVPPPPLGQVYRASRLVQVMDRRTPDDDLSYGDNHYDFSDHATTLYDYDDISIPDDSEEYDSSDVDYRPPSTDYGRGTEGNNLDSEATDEHFSEAAPSSPVGTARPVGEAEANADGVFWDERREAGKPVRWLRLKRCTQCKELVNLGDGSSLHAYNSHYESARCKETARQQHKATGQRRLDDMFARKPSHSTLPAHAQLQSSVSESTFRTSTLKTSDTPSISSVNEADISDAVPEPGTSHSDSLTPDFLQCELRVLLVDSGLCPGSLLHFPDPFITMYPLQLHLLDNLDFIPTYWTDNARLVIRSKSCHRAPRSGGLSCSECASVNTSALVERLRRRAVDLVPTGLNWKYYNYKQMRDALERKNEEKNELKLTVLLSPLSQALSTNPDIRY